MKKRPDLKIGLSADEFKKFYYLKEELVTFCRENGLYTTGGKMELTERIITFLNTGENIQTNKKKTKNLITSITLDSLIEENIHFSEVHRAFFKEQLGNSFSFKVSFQNWLKENSGKSYRDACDAYHQILLEQKNTKTTIGKQFEYNTYIRDFFQDNKNKTLPEAIQCWNYKKSLAGHNQYEKTDLIALTQNLD